MKAVLLATGYHPNMEPLVSYRPSPLLNVADRPIIFHILESLIQQGIKTFDIVLSHFPEQIEKILDDGKRWGISIRYHLSKEPETPFSVLSPVLQGWKDQTILLGQGDHMPILPPLSQTKASNHLLFTFPSNQPCPLGQGNDLSGRGLDPSHPNFEKTPPLREGSPNASPRREDEWSGWALLSTKVLSELPPNTRWNTVPTAIPPCPSLTVKPFISARGLRELMETNESFIRENSQGVFFPTTARNVEPGIWISRAVTIEPGVEVRAPIFIGENTQIRSGTRIGPNAIIENNCLIDTDSVIENSIISQKSYVGETLEIKHCIVDRNSLINLALDTKLKIKEDFILSESTPPRLHRYATELFERALASLLFVLMLPIYFVMRMKTPLKSKNVVALPTSEHPSQPCPLGQGNDLSGRGLDPSHLNFEKTPPLREGSPNASPRREDEWKTFGLLSFDNKGAFRRLPHLWNVMQGHLHFVGSPPRSVGEIKNLPIEWKKIYLLSQAGIITLGDVDASQNEQYASEAFYAVHRSFWFDLKLAFRWLWKKMRKK